MAVKEAQDRAASDRQLMKSKIMNSRKICEENKKSCASEIKLDSKKCDEIMQRGKLRDELEKRQKAENVKKRYNFE